MQIFNDKKKRIGTLSGFKDRAITTTLDSGDKELSVDYRTSGALVDLLKEEYYIRTKTDEFVLKAVEKGDKFNKYTAVLNVEELEGAAFPYGFESNEQTIKACLEFAFEGTGWSVGTCTVTKKRTIDEQESVTAWDVLQKCLTTYRCECIIHSLTKTIEIYDRIGSDRGCYFMEGLNLRKISLKSDTYDFYTRIYPIGKDGITPEWLTGKDYIDNFQYSSKVKAYVWKDERYTNTTSLIEDATAKIEEMSRPYKAYTAEVVDLAKASEKYKDILSYRIGDTVTLVSKKTKTKEKQRIVKITEYPESPEKNTVEISNARKTFAEIQKEETEAATEEAISIANNNTKKVLKDGYYTKTDVESHITAAKDEINLGVSKTLENYSTKEDTKAEIQISASGITQTVSENYYSKSEIDNTLGDYATSSEVSTKISQTAHSVSISASGSGNTAGIKIALYDENGNLIDTEKTANITITGFVSFWDLANAGSTTINGDNITTGTIRGTNSEFTNVKFLEKVYYRYKWGGHTYDYPIFNVDQLGILDFCGSGVHVNFGGSWLFKDSRVYLGSMTQKNQIATIGDIPSVPDLSNYINSVGTPSWSEIWANSWVVTSFSLSAIGSSIYVSGNHIKKNLSDQRLKEYLGKLDERYADFYKMLNPIIFKFHDDIPTIKGKHFGLYANEVADALDKANIDRSGLRLVWQSEVDSEAHEDRYINDKTWNLDYDELHALHIYMIQNQQKEIEQLKSDNLALKGEVDILKKRLGKMEEIQNEVMNKNN